MVFLIRSLLILSLLCTNSFGAISAAMVWEHRTTGNANNGCGYKTGATGTDFSQQNAAQYSLTGVTSAGAGAVALTASAAADMVGNIGNVTGGTNFTTGRREIISVSVGVSITFDANITTGVGANGTIEIGGACTLPTQTAASVVAGNTMWFKTGTFTVTTSPTITPGANGNNTLLQAYSTSRGDSGTATITSSTNSIDLLTFNQASGIQIEQLNFTHTAGTRGACIKGNSVTISSMLIDKSVMDGCLNGFLVSGAGANITLLVTNSEIKNCTGSGIDISRQSITRIWNTWIHACVNGISISGSNQNDVAIFNSVLSSNSGDGLNYSASAANPVMIAFNSVFYANGSDGIDQGANIRMSAFVSNCVFWGNTSFGVRWNGTTAPEIQSSYNNAYGSNSSGARNNFAASYNEITLTVDPFTSSTNFALNNTAGGGAALRALGFSGVSPFGTGYIDVGALQHQETVVVPAQRIYGSTN